jgi:cob(I)alamin adenosyltransferase
VVKLNKIYTRTGDDGTTGLATGDRISKYDVRVRSYGAIDECNSALGIAYIHAAESAELKSDIQRIQNDLFDLGADLSTPITQEALSWEPIRIQQTQIDWLENRIDQLNAPIPPLDSFILPGGSALSAYLHLGRTIARRAETLICELIDQAPDGTSKLALKYTNRLSDYLFVAARYANNQGKDDVKWIPGANR